MYELAVYGIQIIKESSCSVEVNNITSAKDIVKVAAPVVGNKDREHLMVIMLNTKNDVLGVNIVSIGSLNSSIVHPREVFKPAILMNAHSIILVHNHPSGHADPSNEDDKVTKRIRSAGKLLGINLLDHVIVTSSSDYYSYYDNNPILE